MIEVELRVKVPDMRALERKVKALGGKYAYAMKNVDDYYLSAADAAACTFGNGKNCAKPQGGVIRIRALTRGGSKKKTILLTVKTVKNGDLAVRRELQIDVSDAKETERILEYFGCKKVLSLTKNRKIYNIGGTGILLDEIKELGNWMEVSIEGANVDAEDSRAKLYALLEKLGFAAKDVVSKGYFNLAAEKL
ncbi:MAG: class IV adenylate cyclase [Candidatus Micrarchaeia archaeon]|jgi:predicted adenylyl cyclase CyaB